MILWTHTAADESEESIRAAIRGYLERRSDAPPSQVIAEEFSVAGGASRLDVASLSDVLHGYEIKSERDTLTRLDHQVRRFSQVCQFLTVVVSTIHRSTVEDELPSWCGIIVAVTVAGELLLVEERRARENPHWDAGQFVGLLWRDEAIALLDRVGVKCGTTWSRRVLAAALLKSIDKDHVSSLILESVKQRRARPTGELQTPYDG